MKLATLNLTPKMYQYIRTEFANGVGRLTLNRPDKRNALKRDFIEEIQREGTCWCGVTVWQGKTAMRISVSNWSTTAADVDRSLEAMIAIAKSLADD